MASLTLPGPASAATPEDIVAAEAQNTSDILGASLAYSSYASSQSAGYANTVAGGQAPNVSCSQPIVHGREAVRHQDLIVTENHQTDVAFAEAECVSLSRQAFQMSIFIRIEFCKTRTSLTTCTMASTGYTNTGVANAVAGSGTAATAVTLTAVYPDLHEAVGRIRRVYACVRTSLTGSACQTHNYSGTYGH
ncbi:MAG TPA: hypothetical protein VNA14_12360 [Mycobacteriales bacterium]|nr:hypothetical protein [Mycobacteriales bacterium]